MRGVLAGFVIAAVLASGCAEAATLELRLVVSCKPGDHAYQLAGSSEELCLAPTPIFDASGVVSVQRYPVIPRGVMEITQAASDLLYQASTEHTGERTGLVFDDRLIYAPYFSVPVQIKTLPLIFKDNPEDLDALVAAFPGKPAAP
jgi:hypothetical protein